MPRQPPSSSAPASSLWSFVRFRSWSPHSPLLSLLLLLATVAAGGCRSARPGDGPAPAEPQTSLTRPAAASQPGALSPAAWVGPVRATCRPPAGWTPAPLKTTNLSEHQLWTSPSSTTAYGVLNVRHVLMPLASDARILSEFLAEMKRTEGSADLLEQRVDPTLANGIGGTRFVARGGRYTVRANLVSRGRYAWVWYAGTLTGQPVDEAELRAAEAAREQTLVESAGKR